MRYPLAQRGLIALVLGLALAGWFSASAVVPALASQWHLSAGAAAWMTAPVQAGFVLGAVGSAALGLADRIRPHLLVAGCAVGAAACTLVMALPSSSRWLPISSAVQAKEAMRAVTRNRRNESSSRSAW